MVEAGVKDGLQGRAYNLGSTEEGACSTWLAGFPNYVLSMLST